MEICIWTSKQPTPITVTTLLVQMVLKSPAMKQEQTAQKAVSQSTIMLVGSGMNRDCLWILIGQSSICGKCETLK